MSAPRLRTVLPFAAVLLLLGAAPREVVVGEDESLERVAQRTLGSADAAGELRALNGLKAEPAPGTRLKLPGEERDKALSAIGAARNALLQRDGGMGPLAARERLAEAERLFAQAKYAEAATAADAAWKLLSAGEVQPTAFSVEVKPGGSTTVTSKRGQPVRVEAQGVLRSVEPGRRVEVEKGAAPGEAQAPPPPQIPPPAPVIVSPRDQAVLRLRPNGAGQVGPVKLVWKKIAGATGYQIEVVPASGASPLALRSARPQLSLPPLPPGRYRWRVKAVGQGELWSAPSQEQSFELQPAKIKLEVHPPGWK